MPVAMSAILMSAAKSVADGRAVPRSSEVGDGDERPPTYVLTMNSKENAAC